MNFKGYKLTDWIFFFNNKNKNDMEEILGGDKREEINGEFITWKLITVFLPLIPFFLVFIVNSLLNLCYFDESYFSFFNNGSLPIISFGIITSGIPYLLEQLSEYPNFHNIRRRVMAVAIFFLFLSSALYILQTIDFPQYQLNIPTNILSLFLSVYIFLFASSIGFKMFLLQSKHIQTYGENVNENVGKLVDSLNDL